MNGEHKIGAQHLCRQAAVYLRQSSQLQVKNNRESRALQYALASTAQDLGFQNVDVIDDDLGYSASIGSMRREGFDRLLAHVALGEVGLILSREVSRLSRTDKNWCQLFEVCQVFDTLIGDADNIYDLSTMDDQLILGIKGTLSVVELRVIRQRLLQGRENKARRGAYYTILPSGYVLNKSGDLVKDPNERVVQSLVLVFKKFRELQSIRQTFKWFADSQIRLPVNKSTAEGTKIVFQIPCHSFIKNVLRNAVYAGAYVYGQRPMKTIYEDGVLIKKQSGRYLEPEEARIFIRDHHEGYIDWQTYEENRMMIRQNSLRRPIDAAMGVIRSGKGLLVGLIRCGRCGRKIYVRYWGKSGTSARYLCSGKFGAGGKYCIGFGGKTVDIRVSEEVLRAISPQGIKASLEAITQLEKGESTEATLLQKEVVSCEYEARRAFEQYDEVDPRNRLVANQLEQRWNDKLEALQSARSELDHQARRQTLSTKQREQLLGLGNHFSDLWHSMDCTVALKKKIMRTVVEEIIVNETSEGKLQFVIHWKGGAHTSFEMAKPASGKQRRNAVDDIEIIRQMAPHYGDGDIARVLNKQGRTTGNDNSWNRHRVKSARQRQGIAGRAKTIEDPEIFTLNSAARFCNVSDTTIVRLVESGVLPMKQTAFFSPWEIRRSDLESQPVQSILSELKISGRLNFEGVSSEKQQQLFQ